MSDCGVCVGGYDGGDGTFFGRCFRVCRKPFVCEECNHTFPVGTKYEFARGVQDGDFWSCKTCEVCAEIADAFCCDGRTTGTLWEDFRDCYGALTTSCFDKLKTPQAKAELQRRWQEWKFAEAQP